MTDQIIINNAQREKAKAFLRMHQTEGMFVIPNAWDAASAYIYEKAGFAAVATTSAGIAYALGYPDGEQVSLEDLLFVVKKITGRVQIPVSVDFERGYAEDPMQVKENARRLLAVGAVGFNLEDGQADGRLSPLELQIQKIQALCELKKELDLPFVINARTIATTGGINDQKVAYTAGVPASSSAAARTVTGHARTNIITAAKRTDNFLQLYFIIDFLPLFS